MNRRALAFVLAGVVSIAAAGAQEATPEQRLKLRQSERVLYTFTNLDANQAHNVVELAGHLYPSARIFWQAPLRAAVIESVTAGVPATVEAFFKKYDVKSPETRITFLAYLVRGFRTPEPPEKETPPPVPAELKEPIAEMQKNFAYSSYRLLDAVSTPTEGSYHFAEVSDILPNVPNVDRYYYTIKYSMASMPDSKSVTLQPFEFSLKTPQPNMQSPSRGVTTNLTLREGQKLVLGKIRLTENSDLFVILTAKFN